MRRFLPALLWLLLAAAPAAAQVTDSATTNGSVTITTGLTFQTALSAVDMTTTVRRSLTVENNNINGDNCWVFVGSGNPTTPTSILLLPGGSYTRFFPYVPSDPIKVTCTTTGDALYIDTQ